MTADGAFFSLNVGSGERYIPAFALAVGSGDVLGGLVAVVPKLGGAILQLVSPWAVSWLGSLRRWVVLGATVQSLSFVPLIIAALLGWAPVWLVYVAATVYWTSGMTCGAAWTTWVGRLMPERIRSPFIARRNLLCHVCVLLGLLMSGLILEHAGEGHTMHAYAVIFIIAMLARFASARCLASQSESPADVSTHRRVSFREILDRIVHQPDGRLIIYLVAVELTARLAEPFYDPYMLNNLGFVSHYLRYTFLLAAFFVAKAMISPTLGRIAFRFGTRRLLWIGVFTLAPLPALWTVSTDWAYLLVVQAINGMAWAAHELAAILLFFEAIREEERTSIMTTYNLMVAVAGAAGAALGGAILHGFGDTREGYYTLFAVSSAARATAILLLIRATLSVARPASGGSAT